MAFLQYVYSQAGVELTFRLEYLPEAAELAREAAPAERPGCLFRGAQCLAWTDAETGQIRLASPAERTAWGQWLIEQLAADPGLRAEVESRCLEAAQRAVPRRRVRRVSARWGRAA